MSNKLYIFLVPLVLVFAYTIFTNTSTNEEIITNTEPTIMDSVDLPIATETPIDIEDPVEQMDSIEKPVTETPIKKTINVVKPINNIQTAVLASGCFWCMEAIMQETAGVTAAISGYAGGTEINPTYEDVYKEKTSHREAVQVHYDITKISYEEVLNIFWKNIDPTDPDGQFVDKGFPYTTAVFYVGSDEKNIAESTKSETAKNFDKPIATKIIPFTTFYPAEEYHQDFYKKSSTRYNNYTNGSGRKDFKDSVWKDIQEFEETTTDQPVSKSNFWEDLTQADLENNIAKLNDLQKKVTQKDGTEKPWDNTYNDNKEDGIYVDIVSGEPLFSSSDKYDSGSGWPAFTTYITGASIVEKRDLKLWTPRIEVRSEIADSHLGHVFPDGPADKGGLRYCVNSASMKFIPKADMEENGYGEYVQYVL